MDAHPHHDAPLRTYVADARGLVLFEANPLLALVEWQQGHDLARVGSSVIVLAPWLLSVLADERLVSDVRLGGLRGHPALVRWPMYLEGEAHREARAAAVDTVRSALRRLDQGDAPPPTDRPRMSAAWIRREILEIYADVFGVDAGSIEDAYEELRNLHADVLERRAERLDVIWTGLRRRLPLDEPSLSLLAFVVGDSVPSVIHATLTVARYLILLGIETPTEALIVEQILENPPFDNVIRTVGTAAELSDGTVLPVGTRVVVPLSLLNYLDRRGCQRPSRGTVFGVGRHRCPADKLVVRLVEHLLGRSFIPRTEVRRFRRSTSRGVSMLEEIEYRDTGSGSIS